MQGIAADVIAARHRNLLHGVRHATDGYLQRAGRCRFRADLPAAGLAHGLGQFGKALGGSAVVQGRIALRAEHMREPLRLYTAQHHVGVGGSQRATAAVAGRARVGTGGLRADAQPRAVELYEGAAACGHGVDAHHRRTHAHAGDFGIEAALEGTSEMADVGRGAAHVETNDLGMARCQRRAHHADNAAGRAGEDRVLALKALGLGQTARTLHEEQAHARHLRGDLVDIAAQDGRQVGVDDGGVATGHQLDQRADLVRDRDLREADLACQGFSLQFMRVKAVAVQEHDGTGSQAGVIGGLKLRAQAGEVKCLDDLAIGTDALIGFQYLLVQQFGQHDVALEQPWPGLGGNAQRIAKTARGDEQRALALALQQGVRRNGGAHLHAVHQRRCDDRAGRQLEQTAYALDGSVGVLLGVLGQHLQRVELAVGRATNQVGEGAATVDPDLPFCVVRHCFCEEVMST